MGLILVNFHACNLGIVGMGDCHFHWIAISYIRNNVLPGSSKREESKTQEFRTKL